MPFSRVLVAAVVAFAVSALPAHEPASAQAITLKKAKDRGAASDPTVADNTSGEGMSKQQRLTLCLESWDAQTHMSKREWQAACERSVRDYPSAFR